VELLTHLFDIQSIEWPSRIKPLPELAMCITLRRLAYPTRWKDLCELFGLSQSYMSLVFTEVVQHLLHQFGTLVRWHPRLRHYNNLRRFARAVYRHGSCGYIWGFIDGHFVETCRPVQHQRRAYSGHNKAHGLKFQAITTPDGLISSLEGPYEGRDNDWRMFKEGDARRHLEKMLSRPGRRKVFLYGDPAYRCYNIIVSPYHHHLGRAHLSEEQRNFNARLSRTRVSVEHSFGETTQFFTYTCFEKGLRIGKQAVGAFYVVTVLLNNCLICLKGRNQVSDAYVLQPPTIYEYLRFDEPAETAEP